MTIQKITDWAQTDKLTILAVRLALGTGFLSAVVDRFGGWGSYGARQVSWGDFAHFVVYCGSVNGFLPKLLIAPTAWIATIAEILLGIALVLGFYTRWAAILSGLLLGAFALAMSFSLGIKAPLNYSVFTASAAAFLLANVCRTRESSDRKSLARTHLD
ncbi:DoxX family protein [Acidicapsa ligni]|uniref:DoxX family protein n=1 Tax=Acidicapsa ligni TaxID=542300 RepID=UPI0021DF9DFD|nr:DoxX family protein [Acidicapsa ligni]